MKGKGPQRSAVAFTLIELLVSIGIIAILASLLLPALTNAKEQARCVKCMSNLRQIAIALREYSLDTGGKYPWHLPPSEGGTYGSAAGQAWRNFQSLSNELESPLVVVCPSDRKTKSDVMRWADMSLTINRSNAVSYWVGLDCFEEVSASLIAGDRNIAGGKSEDCGSVSASGVRAREYRTNNTSIRWTNGVHRSLGHLVFNDGSAQRTRTRELQELMSAAFKAVVSSGVRTADGKTPSNHILPPRIEK